MDLDWKSGELAEGLDCYRRGEFFQAHEHWEVVWLKAEEPEKSFLQALIQMSSACHHRQRGNAKGAVSLMGKSLLRLESSPPGFGGIDVVTLCAEARECLQLLTEGELQLSVASPRIMVLE